MTRLKKIISALLSLAFAAGAVIPAYADDDVSPAIDSKFTGFVKNVQGTQYYKNGKMLEYQWIKVDGKVYYVSAEGYICRGRCTIDGYTYNFDENGVWDGTREKADQSLKISSVILAEPEELVSLNTVCYDEQLGAKLVETSDKELLAGFWREFSGLKLDKLLTGNVPAYFDAMGVSEKYPIQYISVSFDDGQELTAAFMRDADNKMIIGLDLHSAKDAGKEFFAYEYKRTYYCDYTNFLKSLLKMFAPLSDVSAQKNTGGKAVVGSLRREELPAGVPAEIVPMFRVTDNTEPVYMNEEWWLEKYVKKDKKWKTVEPIGELIFTDAEKEYRLTRSMSQEIPLSCFSPLSSGKYRIVKPYKKQGSDTVRNAYCEFRTVKSGGAGWKCSAKVVFDKEIYPVDEDGTSRVDIGLSYVNADFAVCKVFDVQRETDGKWKSVRTGEIAGLGTKDHYLFPSESFGSVYAWEYDLTKAGKYRAALTVNRIQDGSIRRTDDYDVIYGYFELAEQKKQSIKGVSAAIDGDISEAADSFAVTVKNDGERAVTLKKVKLTDSGGKSSECSASDLFVREKENGTADVTPARALSPGEYTLKLTFGAQGCKDKNVKVKFSVRKASDEEKKSGVLFELEYSGYSPAPKEVRIKVTNRSPEKKDVVPVVATVKKGDKSAGLIFIGQEDKPVKYGKSEWITLRNIAAGTLDDYLEYLAGSLGMTKEQLIQSRTDSEDLEKQFKEMSDDPVTSLREKGTYTAAIMAICRENGKVYEKELTFEIR